LYREKPSKAAKRKSVVIVEPENEKALVPRQAYVEDVPDTDTPPHVPTPPPAVPDSSKRDSVFDYMVDGSQTGTPQISFAKDKEEMTMKHTAPSIFSNSRPSSRNGEEHEHSREYIENGYSWGTEPVKPRGLLDMNSSSLSLEFMTPAAKAVKSKLSKKERPTSHSRTNSGSEKKRKRPTDDHAHESEGDALTVETTKPDTPIIHSGLTGGLSRMMSQDEAYPFRRSADPEDRRDAIIVKERSTRRSQKVEDPTSPLKRTRHNSTKVDSNGLGISIKGRAVKALSMVGGALLAGQGTSEMSNNRTRRRASSSDHGQSLTRIQNGEKRERKKHKVQRHNGTASANIRHEPRSRRRYSDESRSPSEGEGASQKLKAIEYRKHDDSASDSDSENVRGARKTKGQNGDMVVFGAEQKTKRACQSFLANAPGLDADRGYSIHKMLKRWHKHNDVRSSSSKMDEEHELWRNLRIKRNEKGEFVVSF
jgi:cell growth-regulating nucleolar protein